MPRLIKLIACSFALLAFAVPAALADPVTLSGTLEVTHEDTPGGPVPITVLSTADGPQVVTFAPDQPVPPNGAELDVRGNVTGDTLAATSVEVTGPSLAVPGTTAADGAAAQTTTAARTVAIVVITFANGTVPAYSDATLRGVLVSNSNSVSSYFSEQSWGRVAFSGITNPGGDIFRVSIASNPTSACAWATWGTQADAAVGRSLAGYNHVIYVFNSGGLCGFAGLAYMPGSKVYVDNAFQLSVVAHELGHNLGVHHAAALRCHVGSTVVAFANTANACTSSEYGDPYDIMGQSATNQQNAFHKYQSGWLGPANGARVQTITQTGDYTVGSSEQANGMALLLIPGVTAGSNPGNGGGTLGQYFALDLRQTYGTYFDAFAAGSPATAGIEIHLVQKPGTTPLLQTQLIDTTPLTSSFADAPLVPGATFVDATDNISIRLVSIDPLVGATVHVTIGIASAPIDSTPPSAVSDLSAAIAGGPVVSLSFGAATDAGGVASYEIDRDGVKLTALAPGVTTFDDWGASPGTHTYSVIAIDVAGNQSVPATVVAEVPAPVALVPETPDVTPAVVEPVVPATREPAVTVPTRTRNATHVTSRVLARHGKTRRVLVSWKRVTGMRRYTVLRNGHRVGVTRDRTLVDRAAPRGALRYVVRGSR